jgi:hypothetical protein
MPINRTVEIRPVPLYFHIYLIDVPVLLHCTVVPRA